MHAVWAVTSLFIVGTAVWLTIRIGNWLEQRAVAELNGGDSA